jgi:small subunit ribosomal protein S4
MKFNGAKTRLSRRLGVALSPKAQRIMEKRPEPPGQHGASTQRRMSDYAIQLREKQRLRFQYNVSERQMRLYFARASRQKGRTGPNLVRLLETRLDASVLRAGFAPTIYAARQIVGHGHFEVNGHRVTIASYGLKPGDTFRVRERSKKAQIFEMDWAAYTPPGYLERDEASLSAKLVRLPDREEVPITCEETLVVEFYSR